MNKFKKIINKFITINKLKNNNINFEMNDPQYIEGCLGFDICDGNYSFVTLTVCYNKVIISIDPYYKKYVLNNLFMFNEDINEDIDIYDEYILKKILNNVINFKH